MKLPSRDTWTVASAIAASMVVVYVLALSDRATFDDSAPSRLYQLTLDKAYSRFRDTDVVLPYGGSEKNELFHEMDDARPTEPRKPHDHQSPLFTDGARLAREGKYDESAALFRKALEEDPTCVLANHRLGEVFDAAGRWDEALARYQEVLRLDPAHHCAWQHMGEIFRKRGQPEAANRMFENFEQKLRAASTEESPRGQKARLDLLNHYLATGTRTQQALSLARELVDRDGSPKNLELLAKANEAVGNRGVASEIIERIVPVDDKERDRLVAWRERLSGDEAQSRPSVETNGADSRKKKTE